MTSAAIGGKLVDAPPVFAMVDFRCFAAPEHGAELRDFRANGRQIRAVYCPECCKAFVLVDCADGTVAGAQLDLAVWRLQERQS